MAAGLYFFARGFGVLARRRLITSTPQSKIRSAAVGLVEVSGLAVGPHTVHAPISGLPCFYYRTIAWEHKDSGRSNDWQKVADGTTEVHIRQLPGRANAMGVMKFMFPNNQGVYLHDTPQKELLTEASRMFSGGCVRLEDAPRLGRWLFGEPLSSSSSAPEQRVDLAKPVPVYITYLTMLPNGTELATYPDVYNRDRDQLARLGGPTVAAR